MTNSSPKTTSGHNVGSSDGVGNDGRTDQPKVVDKKQPTSSSKQAASRENSWLLFGAIGVATFVIPMMIGYIIRYTRKRNS